MHTLVNGYEVSYRIGDPTAEVRKVGRVDEFGRLRECVLVFRGTWDECISYALAH